MESKRIGNLEIRKAVYICRDEDLPKHISYHIDKWEPNGYYGREADFVKDGEYYRPNDKHYSYCRIHKDCFKNRETCYSIASFDWDRDSYEFRFIGDRPLNLTEEEKKIFWELIDYGFKNLNHGWYEDDEDW